MTNAKVAEMIGRPLTGSKRPGGYITRAKSGLVKKGWLEFIGLEQDKKYRTWKGSRYRAIPHNGWVERKVRELGYDPCARLGAHIQ